MKKGSDPKKSVIQAIEVFFAEKKQPMRMAKKILSKSGKIAVLSQLEALKFSKSDIDYAFQLVFEKVNTAQAISGRDYYPMEKINKLFNLR